MGERKKISDVICKNSFRIYNYFNRKRLYSNEYDFLDNSSNAKNLLLIIAGFQEYYWDTLFSRVKNCQECFQESIDICVCIPGENSELIKEYCIKYGWSCLKIYSDRLSQVQNIAIKLHPGAQWIFKIDEDIILPKYYFSAMKDAYINSETKIMTNIGFLGPLINLNACGLPILLDSLECNEDYVKKFGKLRIGIEETIHSSAELAEWIWEKSLPFDLKADEVRNKNLSEFSIASYRFSIGAILFKREFWESINGFVVGADGVTGIEEEQVCAYCMNHMRNIVIAHDVFVGHLGFYKQKQSIRNFFEKNKSAIELDKEINI